VNLARPVPAPLSPRAAQIVAAARVLLESEGPQALTMRRLGQELGIQAPSIYKHLPGKHAVEVALIEAGLAEVGEAAYRAIEEAPSAPGPDAVASLLTCYRAESLARPNLYRLITAGPLPRADLTPGLEEWAGTPWFLATGDSILAQAMWAFAHGMVILELDRRFLDGSDLDQTWQAGAGAFALAARTA
jgi:AcrR family transcriptional regulator